MKWPPFGVESWRRSRPSLRAFSTWARMPASASCVDDRADVGGEHPRIAERHLLHRAEEHFGEMGGDVFLNIEAAQRRAPLARRLEGRADHVAHRLFGQRGRIDDHRVEAAGFGDQRRAVGRGSRPWRAAISRAVSVEPVKQTPFTRGSEVSLAPTVAPSPGRSCRAGAGTPALCRSDTAKAAMSGVCSAGFATTALPAARAAAIWPVKMASGKFQGLMQAKVPRAGWG